VNFAKADESLRAAHIHPQAAIRFETVQDTDNGFRFSEPNLDGFVLKRQRRLPFADKLFRAEARPPLEQGNQECVQQSKSLNRL
jgi:hypothetical protein